MTRLPNRRSRLGLMRSEVAILVVAAVLAAGGLAAQAALSTKPRESSRVGAKVEASMQATLARSRPPSTTTTTVPPSSSTSTSTSTTSTSTTTTTVAPGSIKWSTTAHTISFGGMQRSYLVAEPIPAPQGRDRLPMIVVLHGVNASPQAEEVRTGFPPIVGPAILVYPAGYNMTWNAGGCCGAAVTAGLNDPGFVTAVAQQVMAAYPVIAPSQAFLVGYSLGGKLAWDIACHGTTVFRGVATYGAVPVSACPHVPAIPAAVLGGNNDPSLAINSSVPPVTEAGFKEMTVDQFVAELRADDSCLGAGVTQTLGTESTVTWNRCAPGKAVVETVYRGEDHTWPEGTATTPSAQQVIWAFFRSLGAQ